MVFLDSISAVVLTGCLLIGFHVDGFHSPSIRKCSGVLAATIAETEYLESSTIGNRILDQMPSRYQSSLEYADMFGLGKTEAGLHCLLDAMRRAGIKFGLKGAPFVLRKCDISKALGEEQSAFEGFFNLDDLKQALQDDFLDASRGSTDNRKGWKIAAVSNPRGDSFEEARMKFEDVEAALEKGTVIFNAAGAHIPKLAGSCLAVSDAAATPNALNLYVTAAGKRTSAPPHTDKQDVVVVQTSGRKAWRVYKPTNPSAKPMADPFARGKGEDNLPLYTLEESGELLIDTTLNAGDVLFVPAGFPHTTATAFDASDDDDTSLHMTFNIDTHVWDLDYLSARRFALRRACVHDVALGQSREEDNRYTGKVNELPHDLHKDIFSALPLGFLEEEPSEVEASIDSITIVLMRIAKDVDPEIFSKVEESIWKETVTRLRQQGTELLEIHREMYLAAIEEGRTRESEEAMTAHLDSARRKAMTPERMQRLSLFRVQRYYESINKVKADMIEWSLSGKSEGTSSTSLPENWAFTLPVKVGDQVEADLGGAFFPATVTRVAGDSFDVKFFDGDQESGLDRSMLKLLKPPSLSDGVDTSNLTPKQLKRLKKQEGKKKGK